MKLKEKIQKIKERRKLAKIEKERIENELEAIEYAKRKERYNDMLRDEALKQKFLTNMSKIKINTYTKKMVAAILAFSILCISASYVLAFLDKQNTLESLSIQLCITILGVAFVYMVRAYFDSKAEHNNLDSKIKEELEGDLTDKINNVLSEAGLNVNIQNFLNNDEDGLEDEETEPSEIARPNALSHGWHNNVKPKDNSVG